MGEANRYVMLMSSLPHYGPLFAAMQLPTSEIKLRRRLKLLAPEDQQKLAMIEDLLQWDHIDSGQTDAELIERAKHIVDGLDDGLLRQVVISRMEQRTFVAALRRRRHGASSPPEAETFGYGRWVKLICRNWHAPAFGLERAFPWLLDAEHCLSEDDAVGLERVLLQEVWTNLGRLSHGHYFDFAAVVMYVLRWNIIDRWTRYDSSEAKERFEELVTKTLAGHDSMFVGEASHG